MTNVQQKTMLIAKEELRICAIQYSNHIDLLAIIRFLRVVCIIRLLFFISFFSGNKFLADDVDNIL